MDICTARGPVPLIAAHPTAQQIVSKGSHVLLPGTAVVRADTKQEEARAPPTHGLEITMTVLEDLGKLTEICTQSVLDVQELRQARPRRDPKYRIATARVIGDGERLAIRRPQRIDAAIELEQLHARPVRHHLEP
jgi:hypothetical protein